MLDVDDFMANGYAKVEQRLLDTSRMRRVRFSGGSGPAI